MADTISRVEAISVSLDYTEMARDQAASSEVQALRNTESSFIMRDEDFGGFSLLCDVSTGGRRPIVPLKWRKAVSSKIHKLSHAGPWPAAKALAKRLSGKISRKTFMNGAKSV